MKKIAFVLSFALISITTFAQYEVEVLDYSKKIYQSDARSVGVGNAFSSVGANMISSSLNPAGLAFYRKSDFVISNAFSFSTTSSDYLNNNTKSRKVNYNIPSIGMVFSNVNEVAGKPVKEGWVNYSFGASVNRTNNYHSRRNFTGINKSSSILDYYSENAQGALPENLSYLTGMAYDAYLIDNFDTLHPTKYFTAIDTSIKSRNLYQSKQLRTSGASYDINFSFAANYSNLIYIGATFGIPTINFNKSYEFYEENNDVNATNYVSSTYKSTLDVDGIGFNAGLGVIISPFPFVRVGGSVQTPTIYNMKEYYYEEISSQLLKYETENQYINGNFDYTLVSPFRANAGIAFILGNLGFVSFDYEYLDYSKAYYDSDVYGFMSENNMIETRYKNVSNIRAGIELKYQIFAVRAGYMLYESPYESGYEPESIDATMDVTSFGIGIREKSYYFDIAYQKAVKSDYFLPYSSENFEVDGANESTTSNNVILTLGLRF